MLRTGVWTFLRVYKQVVMNMSMTQVQLPHSAVYHPSTSRSNNSRHGPYTGDKLISMQCAYTNCLAEPLGRAGHVNPSDVLSNKQANRMSTQGGGCVAPVSM